MASVNWCVSKFSDYLDRSKCKAGLRRLSGVEVTLVAYQPRIYLIAYPAGILIFTFQARIYLIACPAGSRFFYSHKRSDQENASP